MRVIISCKAGEPPSIMIEGDSTDHPEEIAKAFRELKKSLKEDESQ